MIFNRIINDIIDWVRRLLYWKKDEIKKKPYTVLAMYQYEYGLLRLVERDTPRAVSTYIYTPKPNTHLITVVTGMYDYHICLDHLWAVDNPELHVKSFSLNKRVASFKPSGKSTMRRHYGEPTHTLTILKSSRWLDANGDYQTSVLYYKPFDFIGRDSTQYRDKYALPILKDVINQLKNNPFDEIDWDWELNFSQRRFMGAYYIKPEELPQTPTTTAMLTR